MDTQGGRDGRSSRPGWWGARGTDRERPQGHATRQESHRVAETHTRVRDSVRATVRAPGETHKRQRDPETERERQRDTRGMGREGRLLLVQEREWKASHFWGLKLGCAQVLGGPGSLALGFLLPSPVEWVLRGRRRRGAPPGRDRGHGSPGDSSQRDPSLSTCWGQTLSRFCGSGAHIKPSHRTGKAQSAGPAPAHTGGGPRRPHHKPPCCTACWGTLPPRWLRPPVRPPPRQSWLQLLSQMRGWSRARSRCAAHR